MSAKCVKYLKFDLRPYAFWIACVIFGGVFVATDFTIADALGMLVLLSAILGQKVVDHLFPKQPDLFQEISDLRKAVENLTKRSELSERDLTALKIGKGMR